MAVPGTFSVNPLTNLFEEVAPSTGGGSEQAIQKKIVVSNYGTWYLARTFIVL